MKLIRLLLTALLFVVACILLPTGMSKVSAISVIVSSDSPGSLKIYLDDSYKQAAFSEINSSPLLEMPVEGKKKILFRFPGTPPATWLRLDPGEHPGTIKIYSMIVQQALGRRLYFDAGDIFKGFHAGRDGISIILKDDYLEIVSTVEDPFLVSNSGFISKPRPILFYLPVLLLSFFFYNFIAKVDSETLKNIFLPRRQLRVGMQAIAPLDGLRGFALLLVVADHTWGWFLGAGASGVLIFFVLSGFLLSRPFVTNPGMLCNVQSLLDYGGRRLQRILPMYYLYLFLTFGLALRLYELFLHLFFIEATGHLWAIPQEMAFYIVFPIIIIFNYHVLRSRLLFIVPGLLLMVVAWYQWVTIKEVYLYGMMNAKLPFRLDIFLIGVLCSYFYFGIWQKKQAVVMPAFVKQVFVIVALALLVLFLCFSNGYLLQNRRIYAQIYYLYFAIGAGVVIFILASSGENFLTRILSGSLLSSLGVVSYSLYLFHPLVIKFVKYSGGSLVASGAVRFVLVLVISYIISCLLFYFIENCSYYCVFVVVLNCYGFVPRRVSSLLLQGCSLNSRWYLIFLQKNFHLFKDEYNGWKFRGKHFEQTPDERYRLVVAGDSFTWGQGVYPASERFTERIDLFLNKPENTSAIEVVNAGICGFNLPNHYKFLHFIDAIKLDYVLYQWFINDMVLKPDFAQYKTAHLIKNRTVHTWLWKHSALYYLLQRGYGSMQRKDGSKKSYSQYLLESMSDPKGASAVKARDLLIRYIEHYQENNTDFGIVLFPSFYSPMDKYTLGFLHEQVLEVCAEKEIECLDLRSSYSDVEYIKLWANVFDPHPSALANKIALMRFMSFLAPLGKLQQGKKRYGNMLPLRKKHY